MTSWAASGEHAVYVFNHVPRTAGGAIAELMGRAFRIVPDYPGRTASDLDRWLANPIALDTLGSGDVLIGHFTAPGGRLYERYPEVFANPRFRLITFMREPIAWVESHLRYFGAAALGCEGIDEVLAYLAGAFARAYRTPEGQTFATPLEPYWFIGVCDRVELDAARMLERMNMPPAALSSVNRAQARPVLLDPNQRERYRKLAAEDFALFDWAARR